MSYTGSTMSSADHIAMLAEALKDIDPAKFPHGLEQYARFGPRTARAILEVRDLVVHTPGMEDAKFRIGLTAEPAAREAEERGAGCAGFRTVFESDDTEEVRTVEADVRLNFLWHFPGRCLNKGDYRQEADQGDKRLFVYVVCYPADAYGIPGKA